MFKDMPRNLSDLAKVTQLGRQRTSNYLVIIEFRVKRVGCSQKLVLQPFCPLVSGPLAKVLINN